jgi:hypothetical protein
MQLNITDIVHLYLSSKEIAGGCGRSTIISNYRAMSFTAIELCAGGGGQALGL